MKTQEEKFEDIYQLTHYAFQFEQSEAYRNRLQYIVDHSKHYASYDGENLASQIIATPLKVQFFNQTFDMTGIGFVASDPCYRGGGRIDQLMTQIIQDAKEKDVLFSYLAPFSYPFYRRYGYELIFERIAYKMPSSEWPDSKRVAGYVRRLDWTQAKPELQAIYTASKENKHGGLLREDWWYDYKFSIQRPYYFAVYYNEKNEAEGYLVYQIKDGIFNCAEWVCLTGNAYKSLNRYIATHKESVREIHYEQGYNKSNSFFMQERPIASATIRPEMMVRIIDIKKFLTIFDFSNLSQSFAIVIEEDSYAPWNTGIYEVHADTQKISKVEKTTLPTLTLTVQRFTQLFLGYKTLTELAFYDFVKVEEELIAVIEAVMPTQTPVLEDYF
ncbi:GNAT family N-acetyltransferase [Candidatus Enterococcus willemsii]|uniref:N-acetyltransferase domain-containing protein n=1 Tax=Candidatus Enterococcus willemsii TaxID=1857215 RepID=A0ABQ6YYX7_9ENTE|nr:GNAT family N-acetyltransferase [Enterococcus sp. CU12B]KAF1303472.1 hypothetical protein BAU17_12240 [Enterococcus sp. CU12B]